MALLLVSKFPGLVTVCSSSQLLVKKPAYSSVIFLNLYVIFTKFPFIFGVMGGLTGDVNLISSSGKKRIPGILPLLRINLSRLMLRLLDHLLIGPPDWGKCYSSGFWHQDAIAGLSAYDEH